MEFKLNDYHRNIPDSELIDDIKRVAKKLQKDSLTIEEYDKIGKYHHTTITRRFGSWKKALLLAELDVNGHNFRIADIDYIKDIIRVSNILKKDTVTSTEYTEYGIYNREKIATRFGSWENALIQAGLKPTGYIVKISKQELLEEIERIWIKLGRQPTTTDIKNGVSKYSLNSYARKFGGWRGALKAFVDWVNEKADEAEIVETENEPKESTRSETKPAAHKTKRDINLRLRFKVMQRDNFKCVFCGASPAKDSSVELHIDHIIPWSKGGETVIDNLQTLCSKCNLGKSDLL